MRVLLTGATGFIGRILSARLAADGHTLRFLTRDPVAASGRLPPGSKAFAWPSGGMVPDQAMDGVEAVVHLAGENIGQWPWTRDRKNLILESRTQGTRRLVEAMGRAAAKPTVLVAAAAVGYYGDGGDRDLDEGSEPGTGFLAEVCVAWEREIFRASEMGIRTVAVRNGLVLGQGGALKKLLPVYRFGAGAVLGSGRQWWSWVHVEDTAGIFAHALSAEGLSGAINGTAPAPVMQREFAKALTKAVHRPLLFKVPTFALRIPLGEMAATLLEGQKTDGTKLAASGYRFRYPRLEAALAEITQGHQK
ncbi:MAG: TIGR01777 family oxidoreductase [Fibrobacterota bacterium]|nr:TIGR01777 family oxidoreductase [Fibrobacterota bacterium]